MLNWNFQYINGKTHLTGIQTQGTCNRFKSVSEDEIELIESTRTGLFIRTNNQDVFCKYSDIGITQPKIELGDPKMSVIAEVCRFEQDYLNNPQFMRELGCVCEIPENVRKSHSGNSVTRLPEFLFRGLCEKIARINKKLTNDTIRMNLYENKFSTGVYYKTGGHVFCDEYAEVSIRGESCKLEYALQDFVFSYLISGTEITMLEVPEDVRELTICPQDLQEQFLLLKKDGTSIKIEDSEVTVKITDVF